MGEKEGRRTEGKDERQEETERDTKCRWRRGVAREVAIFAERKIKGKRQRERERESIRGSRDKARRRDPKDR